MSSEFFNTATWNFLIGNRDVESIIRNHPGTLIVRGGIASVLPTVNSLRDLRCIGWKDFPDVPVVTPGNTLTSFAPSLGDTGVNGNLFSTLLEKSYGIQVRRTAISIGNSLVFLVNDPENHLDIRDILNEAVKPGNQNRIIVVLPSQDNLSPFCKSVLQKSVFSSIFEGNNIFFPSNVEELLWDYVPEHIFIIGTDPQRVFYSAVGATDWFIVNGSRFRNPNSMHLWDLHEFGRKVTVVMPEGKKSNSTTPGNGSATLRDSILAHLTSHLNVSSTDDDFRFTPVPGHKIAIDIMG